jgi:hypothetical protein
MLSFLGSQLPSKATRVSTFLHKHQHPAVYIPERLRIAQHREVGLQIYAEAWAGLLPDVELVGREGREGGVLTSSRLFLCNIRWDSVSV